jgi:hypothetical protein
MGQRPWGRKGRGFPHGVQSPETVQPTSRPNPWHGQPRVVKPVTVEALEGNEATTVFESHGKGYMRHEACGAKFLV